MAINVYSLGTAAARRVAGDPAVSYPFTVPAAFPSITIIRFKVRLSGYTASATDSKGNSYAMSGADTLTLTGTYTPLASGDTITVTFTPTAGGAGYFLLAGYAVTGADFFIFNYATTDTTSGSTATATWGPMDYAANLTAAGKTARAAAYVAELTYEAQYNLLGTGVPPVTISITGEPAHTNLNDVNLHTVAGNTFADDIQGLWHSFRIYTTGRGNGESGTVGGSSNYPNPTIGNLNGIAYYADTSTPPAPNGGPWILAPRRGGFHIAYADTGNIKYRTCHVPGSPSFGSTITVTSAGTDGEPRMVDTGRQGRIYIIFSRDPDVYYTFSDGDGEAGTWNTPTLMFSGCKHPTIAFDPRNGMLWLGAYDASAGKIKASVIQPIGTAPTTPYYIQSDTGADLSGFDDDTFHVAPAYEGGGRWELIAMKGGAATVWQSVDDGLSFKQIV